MSKFDQSYHRVATLGEAAAEDTSQAAKRATIHALMKGEALTLCGRFTYEHVKTMGVLRIVDCPECREKLIEANRKAKGASFTKIPEIGSPVSQRIADLTPEQKHAMLMQIEEMQESGEWDRMVQQIHAEASNRRFPQVDLSNHTARGISSNIERDAATLNKLRACCGYIENGSGEYLTIGQDDATRGWGIRIGDSLARKEGRDRSYHADGFYEVIDTAYRAEKQEN